MTSPGSKSLSERLRLSSEDTSPGISFADCVAACLNTPEFVTNWQRLRGVRLPASALERLIDNGTGYSDHVARMFLDDVLDLVYLRLPEGVRSK